MAQNKHNQKKSELLKEIEFLRKSLQNHNLNNDDPSLNSNEILEISKRLDKKINEFYRLTEQ